MTGMHSQSTGPCWAFHKVAVGLFVLLVPLLQPGWFATAADPIRVDFYMEALCPYCANFTVHGLKPLFENKLISFVQLDVIPWGNARLDVHSGTIKCQHGQRECELNKLISCAISQRSVQDDWFPFLECVETKVVQGSKDIAVDDVAHECGTHAGLIPDKLLECYNGEQGNTLQRLAAQRTASLKPPHQYVPWVVVNGIPLLNDDTNIIRYICVAYTGRDRPSVCLDVPRIPTSQQQKTALTVARKQNPTQQHMRCQPKGNSLRRCSAPWWQIFREQLLLWQR
eukprot:GHRR01006486.1.p1 GENE.GHRR01006486.1~~GHRR01006486.1.p1  ORF type:complete len:283 (+),score=59.25 GHRR01006486.1:368-1216(+)